MLYELKSQEARDKAVIEDMAVVFQARETYQGNQTNDLLQYKTPFDTAVADAQTAKTAWDAAVVTLTEKTTAFNTAKTAYDNRDQSQDGQTVNNDLETAKNTAKTEMDTAQTTADTKEGEYNTEFAKIAPLETTYNEKRDEADETYAAWLITSTEEFMWGKEA